jgi:spore maturation protein CgeB
MRILFVDTIYSSVLDGIGYFDAPNDQETFGDLTESLNNQKFATGYMYARELEKLGHEVSVVYANSLKSQSSWLKSNLGISISTHPFFWRNWQLLSRIPFVGRLIQNQSAIVKILLSQIKDFRPDVVYVLNINALNKKLILKIQKMGPVIVGQIASPLPPKFFYEGYDHIFSAHPGQVEFFNRSGLSSSFIPLAFDYDNFEAMNFEGWPERVRDVTFVGTFGRHQKNTAPLLTALSKEIPTLEIYTFAPKKKLEKYGLAQHLKGKAWGSKMLRILAESKIVINRHGEVADGYSVNFRLFEGTGMGALVLTERSKNLSDLFAPEAEVLQYSSPPEAARIAKEALENFDEYSRIAKAGQRKTLSEHTYANRAVDLDIELRALLSSKKETLTP